MDQTNDTQNEATNDDAVMGATEQAMSLLEMKIADGTGALRHAALCGEDSYEASDEIWEQIRQVKVMLGASEAAPDENVRGAQVDILFGVLERFFAALELARDAEILRREREAEMRGH